MSARAASTAAKRKLKEIQNPAASKKNISSKATAPNDQTIKSNKRNEKNPKKTLNSNEIVPQGSGSDVDEGSLQGLTLAEAIQRGLKKSNVRLEPPFSDSSLVGSMCSIYWPDDDAWYGGRIALVSTDGNKCFVYYDDFMTEWVDLNKTVMSIYVQLVIERNWAAHRLWLSSKALNSAEYQKVKTGRVLITYLHDHKSEHGFFKESDLIDFFDSKANRKKLKNLNLALQEIELKREFIMTVQEAFQTCPLSKWSGTDLVGWQISTALAAFITDHSGEDEGSISGTRKRRRTIQSKSKDGVADLGNKLYGNGPRIIGHIRAYSVALNKFYVLWTLDELSNIADVDLSICRFVPPWIRFQGSSDSIDVCNSASLILSASFPSLETLLVSGKYEANERVVTEKENSEEMDFPLECCTLCGEAVLNFCGSPINEDVLDVFDRSDSYEEIYDSVFELKECQVCKKKYHGSCMPDIVASEKLKKSPQRSECDFWTCWFCLGMWCTMRSVCECCCLRVSVIMLACEECNATAWSTALKKVFLTDVLTSPGLQKFSAKHGKSLNFGQKLVCDECSHKFSELKHEYCPICTQSYPSEEELRKGLSRSKVSNGPADDLFSLPIPTASGAIQLPYVFPNVDCSNGLYMLVKDNSLGESTVGVQLLDESCDGMVECNECSRWVHAKCESINQAAFEAIGNESHPIWGCEYLCPMCRYNVCNSLLTELEDHDIYGLFAEPVTEDVAPGYSEIIRNPMDLTTMKSKLNSGVYKSVNTLRQDFELICDNALKFNKHGDKYWKATLVFFLRGEASFAASRISSVSVFGESIMKSVSRDEVKRGIGDICKCSGLKTAKAPESDSTRKVTSHKTSTSGLFETPGYDVPMWINRWFSEGSMGSKELSSNAEDNNINDIYSRSYSNGRKKREYGTETAAQVEVDVVKRKERKDKEQSAVVADASGCSSNLPAINLPKVLSGSTHTSFIKGSISVLDPEYAFYDCSCDRCQICGASDSSSGLKGDDLRLVFCASCGEAFHRYCIHTVEATSSGAQSTFDSCITKISDDWKCINCSSCAECGVNSGGDDEEYVYCDSCDRAYHLGCIIPAMRSAPSGKWFCKKCVHCCKCLTGTGPDVFDFSEFDYNDSCGRIWGQRQDLCIICTLTCFSSGTPLPKSCKLAGYAFMPTSGLYKELSLKAECVRCKEALTAMDNGSLFGMRCSLCLSHQHFECSDEVFSNFMKNTLGCTGRPGNGKYLMWWENVYNKSLTEYFTKLSSNFTCSNCSELALERSNTKKIFHRNLQPTLCNIQKRIFLSKLYRDKMLPLRHEFDIKQRQIWFLLACRISLDQAIRCYESILIYFPLIEAEIPVAFAKSRRKPALIENVETVLSLWMWNRSLKFLDIINYNIAKKGTDEVTFLKSFNDFVIKLREFSEEQIAINLNYFLEEENFRRLIQLSALSSSFFCCVNALLKVCGHGQEKYNMFEVIHDRLCLWSAESILYFEQCWQYRCKEDEVLRDMYSAPGVEFVGDPISSKEDNITVALKCGGQTMNVTCRDSYATQDTVAVLDAKVEGGDTADLTSQSVPASISKKKMSKAVEKHHVIKFLKKLLGKCSKSQSNKDADKKNLLVTSEPHLSTTADIPSSVSEITAVSQNMNPQYTWSLSITEYASALMKYFDLGFLRDCPRGEQKLRYIAQKLECPEQIVALKYEGNISMGSFYTENDCKSTDLDILDHLKQACSEELKMNRLRKVEAQETDSSFISSEPSSNNNIVCENKEAPDNEVILKEEMRSEVLENILAELEKLETEKIVRHMRIQISGTWVFERMDWVYRHLLKRRNQELPPLSTAFDYSDANSIVSVPQIDDILSMYTFIVKCCSHFRNQFLSQKVSNDTDNPEAQLQRKCSRQLWDMFLKFFTSICGSTSMTSEDVVNSGRVHVLFKKGVPENSAADFSEIITPPLDQIGGINPPFEEVGDSSAPSAVERLLYREISTSGGNDHGSKNLSENAVAHCNSIGMKAENEFQDSLTMASNIPNPDEWGHNHMPYDSDQRSCNSKTDDALKRGVGSFDLSPAKRGETGTKIFLDEEAKMNTADIGSQASREALINTGDVLEEGTGPNCIEMAIHGAAFKGLGHLRAFQPINSTSLKCADNESSSCGQIYMYKCSGIDSYHSFNLPPEHTNGYSETGKVYGAIYSKDCASEINFVDCQRCSLCHRSAADSAKMEGRLIVLPKSNITGGNVHVNCLVWSSGIVERASGRVSDALAVLKRGDVSKCSFCGEEGATLCCELPRCKHMYHFRCAVNVRCRFFEVTVKEEHCAERKHARKVEYNVKSEVNSFPLSEEGSENIADPLSHPINLNSFGRGDRRTVVFCPEHGIVADSLEWGNGIFQMGPQEPRRPITVDPNDWILPFQKDMAKIAGKKVGNNTSNKEQKSILSQMLRDSIACLRMGALTIHSIGHLPINSPWFHEVDIMFPVGFESTRIFWSYMFPGQRTLYRFDILSSTGSYFRRNKNNSEYSESELDEGVNDKNNPEYDNMSQAWLPTSFPVFRVVAMDDPLCPFLSFNVEHCYKWVHDKVSICRSQRVVEDSEKKGKLDSDLSCKKGVFKVKRANRSSASLNGKYTLQFRIKALCFFGLGTHFVRNSMELDRSSIVCMIPSVCYPVSQFLSPQIVAEIHETAKFLTEKYGVTSSESLDLKMRIVNQSLIPSYRPGFVLPETLSTVNVLRRLADFRRNFKSLNQKQYDISCTRVLGFNSKRYDGGPDDETKFDILSATATQLLSQSKHGGSHGKDRRNSGRQVTENASVRLAEKFSSPIATAKTVELISSPSALNLSSEELRVKLEMDYWEMHDNNIYEVHKHLAVQRSGIHGWGIYALRDFLPNSMIVEYVGEMVRHTLADLREVIYESETGLSGSCYLFRLDKDLVVDATHAGGMARFLNHSCEPTCYAYIVSTGFVRPAKSPKFHFTEDKIIGPHNLTRNCELEQKHIVIMAARHIKKGEEITYDYKFPIEEGEKLICHCGASRCRGSMN